MTGHDRDRRFLAWLRTASATQLARAWTRAWRPWHREAIVRAARRLALVRREAADRAERLAADNAARLSGDRSDLVAHAAD